MSKRAKGPVAGVEWSHRLSVLLITILGLIGAGVCAYELTAERNGDTQWGVFTAESVRCEWRSCFATGRWESDDGAIRLDAARVASDLGEGDRIRAGLRWGGLGGGLRENADLVTENSAAARQGVLAAMAVVIAALTASCWWSPRTRGCASPGDGAGRAALLSVVQNPRASGSG